MTTGKTIALTRRTFVEKAMSLLFNMPSRLVITLGEVIGSIGGTNTQLLHKRVFSLKTKKICIYGLSDLFLLVYKRGLVGWWYYNKVHLGAGGGFRAFLTIRLYRGHASVQKKIIHFFNRVWGSNVFQFFSIHVKCLHFEWGMGLEEVALVWKREDQFPVLSVFSLVPQIEGVPSLWSGSKATPITYASLNFGVHLGLTTFMWVPWAFLLFLSYLPFHLKMEGVKP